MCGHNALHIDRNFKRRRLIDLSLEPLGFNLHDASNISIAQRLIRNHFYQLVLMNYGTLGKKIFEFCSQVHFENIETLLIVLMASNRISIEEHLFECGVSDVVTGRQADARVLSKRIKAHFNFDHFSNSEHNIVRLKNTIVDFDRREVWCKGQTRRLPGILKDLLTYFIENPNRVISRDELRNCPIWSDSICTEPAEGGKTFDVSMSKLKKIIEANPSEPEIIKTVRGVGWKLIRE